MNLQKALHNIYGDDADLIEEEMRNEVFNTLQNGGRSEDVEDIMIGYGLEMDYIFDLI